MKRNLLKGFTAAVSVVTAVALAGCGAASNTTTGSTPAPAAGTDTKAADAGKPVKLKIYAQYADADTKGPYDYAVAELKKEMPNVELELDVQSQDDGQKLKTYAATGNLPDIFGVALDQIEAFKKSGNILQLDDYVAKSGFKDKMQPSAMNTLTAPDGHIYSFPYAGNEMVLLFYNKELFKQAGVDVPQTYDQLLAAVKTFNAKNITPMALFAKEKWPCVALYDILATRLEPAGITKLDKLEAKASDEPYKKAAERLSELVKAGLLQKGATNTNYDQAAALFHEGKAAMFVNGQWEIEAATKALGDKVGYMYYPADSAATIDKTKYAFSGGGGPGGYAVNPKSKNKDLAVKVAEFISLKYAEYKYTQKGSPIVSTKVTKPIEKQFDPLMQQLANDIPKITSMTSFAWGLGNAKVKAALEDATQNLMTSGYTPEQFVKDVDAAIANAKK
ncbi:ABC transporter substrate-binding protein [Paenibacillus chartarius]|uniref:ABC transporter substrate-binding protein n=1 Tax=Paenibacillus chartarius TaxID=747481 RepID=A0ABV6DFU6_9BACL